MKIEISQDTNKHFSRAIFTIPLPDRPPVYMSFDLIENLNDTWSCVIVDSFKFLRLWRNDPFHIEEAMGNSETWKQDYKFDRAAEGFSRGKENPVPLAYVNYRKTSYSETNYKFFKLWKSISIKEVPAVRFTDGITRSIWLMANHCPRFPLKCELPGAEELHKFAGANNSSIFLISDLIGTKFKKI